MKWCALFVTGLCLSVGFSHANAASSADAAQGAMLPQPLMNDAHAAKDAFENGRYLDAQKIYEAMLTKAPDNLYVLSNLGVVYFRNSKWELAEKSLKKALAIAPGDAFSSCTLGIVCFQEKRNDKATKCVEQALAIDPKNQEAKNYLEYLNVIPTGPGSNAKVAPVGDFETEHERAIRRGRDMGFESSAPGYWIR